MDARQQGRDNALPQKLLRLSRSPKTWIVLLVVVAIVIGVNAVSHSRQRNQGLESLARQAQSTVGAQAGDGQSYGIDVSNHQGSIAWKNVARHGIDYAYIKASEGEDWADASFTTNWDRASSTGVTVGAYHFYSLCSSGEDQASFFISRLNEVGMDDDDLAPALDLELDGNCSQRPEADDLMSNLQTFIDQVEQATGKTIVLYIPQSFQTAYPEVGGLQGDTWVAAPQTDPGDQWSWWQVSVQANVTGIDSEVDLNIVDAAR